MGKWNKGNTMWKWVVEHPRLWMAVIGAAFLSLAPLAWLQYRWIGQISQADRERRTAHLAAAVARFVQDFDGEVNRLYRALLTGPPGPPEMEAAMLARRFAVLEEADVDPRLTRDFYLSRGGESGVAELLRFDRNDGRFTPVSWPASLERLRDRLMPPPRPGGPPSAAPFVPVEGTIPALLAPRWRPARPGEPPVVPGVPRVEYAGWLIAELNLDFITKEMLPELARRHFLAGETEFALRIVNGRRPERIIYDSDPALPGDSFASPDATAPLFAVHLDGPPRFGRLRPFLPRFGGQGAGRGWRFDEPPQGRLPGAWLLLVKHRAGSLEAAVVQTRRRNLTISLAVLLLMAVSLALLLVTTRRAQRLARLQMEFVAGVSHELRTPLSVICSAADNLADGLVTGEQQVRRYGSVIRGEGWRLSQMVEQILRFAGIQSGRAKYDLQPAGVGEIVLKAVAACEPEMRAAGCQLESSVDPDLPPVLADPTSLAHALRNLIDNALTHGGQGQWIGVRACGRSNGVAIMVEDRGPGIDPADLPRIFDPFYRGRRAAREQARGFGLGLALAKRIVEAHAGTLTVESAPGQGAKFVVWIPALTDETAQACDEFNGAKNPAYRG